VSRLHVLTIIDIKPRPTPSLFAFDIQSNDEAKTAPVLMNIHLDTTFSGSLLQRRYKYHLLILESDDAAALEKDVVATYLEKDVVATYL